MKNYVTVEKSKKISDLGKVYLMMVCFFVANIGINFLPSLSIKIIALTGLVFFYLMHFGDSKFFSYIRNKYDRYPFAAGADTFFYLTVSANFLLLTRFNENSNPLTMEILTVVAIVLLLLFFEIGKIRFNDHKSSFSRLYAFLLGLLCLAAVVSIYMNFGSLYIWLSIVLIFLMAWVRVIDVILIIFGIFGKRERCLDWMTRVLVCLGVVSTLFQFWRNIIDGLTWFFSYDLFGTTVFSWLIILAGASLFFFGARKLLSFIDKKRKMILVLKKKKEAELAKIEEVKKKKEKNKKLEEKIKNESEYYFDDFFREAREMTLRDRLWFMKYPHSVSLKEFLNKYGRKKFIEEISLRGLMNISDQKKQIVFNHEDVKTVFIFLETIAEESYDDNILNAVLAVADYLFTPYERPNGETWDEYKGLNNLREIFNDCCPTIKNLWEK